MQRATLNCLYFLKISPFPRSAPLSATQQKNELISYQLLKPPGLPSPFPLLLPSLQGKGCPLPHQVQPHNTCTWAHTLHPPDPYYHDHSLPPPPPAKLYSSLPSHMSRKETLAVLAVGKEDEELLHFISNLFTISSPTLLFSLQAHGSARYPPPRCGIMAPGCQLHRHSVASQGGRRTVTPASSGTTWLLSLLRLPDRTPSAPAPYPSLTQASPLHSACRSPRDPQLGMAETLTHPYAPFQTTALPLLLLKTETWATPLPAHLLLTHPTDDQEL